MHTIYSFESYDRTVSMNDVSNSLKRLYPHIKETENNITIPRKWDIAQASSYLNLSPNGLVVSFKDDAAIKEDQDPSGVVRADSSIPASIGTYYFEILILSGQYGCMGVGLSKATGELNRMPGWDPHCFGYHGDDGNFFSACGHGTAYGPKFGTGDVIGCGIDTVLNIVFFTKNGKHLGIAYDGPGPLVDLYPTVGCKSPKERLTTNFGQRTFMFNFYGYKEFLDNKKIHMLEDVKMPHDIGKHMDRTIISFLGHIGALETLKKFEKVSKSDEKIDHELLRKKKELRDMILFGVDNLSQGAVIQERIEEYFPGAIEQDKRVHLLLLCLRYIDLANTLHRVPVTANGDSVGHERSATPTEVCSRQPKLLKGIHCKSTKRTRDVSKKRDQVHTPSPVRRTMTKTSEDLYLKNTKIESFFLDEDTEEEMLRIDGVSMPKKMFVELQTSGEYEKLNYLMKMGKEIMSLASKVQHEMDDNDRKILEISTSICLSQDYLRLCPLNSGLQYIIHHSVVEMINNYKSPQQKAQESVMANEELFTPDDHNNIKEKRIYSELRGMFLAWKGLHHDAGLKDNKAASIHFLRRLVLDGMLFIRDEPVYSDEPIEQGREVQRAHYDNGMVVDGGEGIGNEEQDV